MFVLTNPWAHGEILCCIAGEMKIMLILYLFIHFDSSHKIQVLSTEKLKRKFKSTWSNTWSKRTWVKGILYSLSDKCRIILTKTVRWWSTVKRHETVSHKWNAIFWGIMSWTQKEENECWVFQTSLKGVFESVASKKWKTMIAYDCRTTELQICHT